MHCGRQRHFDGAGIDPQKLLLLDALVCNHFGQGGNTVAIIPYESPLPFALEPLPSPRNWVPKLTAQR